MGTRLVDELKSVLESDHSQLLLRHEEALRRAIAVVEAVERHRDAKGDDRCWLDDLDLYDKLDPTVQLDLRLPPKCDFLQSCARYWDQRQPQSRVSRDLGGMVTTRTDPNRLTMAQLQAEVERLGEAMDIMAYGELVGQDAKVVT